MTPSFQIADFGLSFQLSETERRVNIGTHVRYYTQRQEVLSTVPAGKFWDVLMANICVVHCVLILPF